MFWFKSKKIVVDCFINLPPVHELFPIDYSYKFFPPGWKELPNVRMMKANHLPHSKIEIPVASTKRCVGIQNLFTTGFILPSWTDFTLEVTSNGQINTVDPMNNLRADTHPDWMWWPDLYRGQTHVKLQSPWLIRENSGIKFAWNQCDWHNTDRIANAHVLSGVLDYKAQHNTHVNMFMKKGTILNVKAGDPLAHIMPLTEKEVELKNHLVDNDEYARIANTFTTKFMWFGQHKALFSSRKKSQCPFHYETEVK